MSTRAMYGGKGNALQNCITAIKKQKAMNSAREKDVLNWKETLQVCKNENTKERARTEM